MTERGLFAPRPTSYGGFTFRSRLEAKWAAVFDQMGWNWDYEPFDLVGYIPDFLLKFPANEVLVEVKPFTGVPHRSDAAKLVMARHRPNTKLLLCGAGLECIYLFHPGTGWEPALIEHYRRRNAGCGFFTILPTVGETCCDLRYGIDLRELEDDSWWGGLSRLWGKAHKLTRWRADE